MTVWKNLESIAPCHFGLEAVLKREILDLGYEISKVEDGKSNFSWLMLRESADANVFLRTAERILSEGRQRSRQRPLRSCFRRTKATCLGSSLSRRMANSGWQRPLLLKSKLFSPSDIQSIMKKAMVERLKERLPCILVSRGRSQLPNCVCALYEGCGYHWHRHFRE